MSEGSEAAAFAAELESLTAELRAWRARAEDAEARALLMEDEMQSSWEK